MHVENGHVCLLLNCLVCAKEYHNSIKFGLPQTTRLLCKFKLQKNFLMAINQLKFHLAIEYTFQVTKLVELNIKQ